MYHIWLEIPRSFSLSSHILRASSSEVQSFLGGICCWAVHIFISYVFRSNHWTGTLHAEKYPPLLSEMESSRQQYWGGLNIVSKFPTLYQKLHTRVVWAPCSGVSAIFMNILPKHPMPRFLRPFFSKRSVSTKPEGICHSINGKIFTFPYAYPDEDWMPGFQRPWASWQVPLHEECSPPLTEYKLVHGHIPFSPCSNHPTWPLFSICAPRLIH